MNISPHGVPKAGDWVTPYQAPGSFVLRICDNKEDTLRNVNDMVMLESDHPVRLALMHRHGLMVQGDRIVMHPEKCIYLGSEDGWVLCDYHPSTYKSSMIEQIMMEETP